MKANKALKRLARIEVSLSAVTERYSASTPQIREALDDARAAVTRAKAAVGLQTRRAKNAPVKSSKPVSKAAPEPPKHKGRISAEGMKNIVAATKKRWDRVRAEAAQAQPARSGRSGRKRAAVKRAVKAGPAKTVKRVAPVKKAAVKKAAAAKTVPAPEQVFGEAVAL